MKCCSQGLAGRVCGFVTGVVVVVMMMVEVYGSPRRNLDLVLKKVVFPLNVLFTPPRTRGRDAPARRANTSKLFTGAPHCPLSHRLFYDDFLVSSS